MNFTLFCISLIMPFTMASVEDLYCYTCFYNEDHPYSDASCLDNPVPETFKKCTQPLIPGLLYGRTPQLNLSLSSDKLCHTYTATVNGKPIVIRGCYAELGTVARNCTTDVFLLFDGKEEKDLKSCFCSTNGCNDEPYRQLISSTVKPRHNDASRYRLTSNLSLTVIIYSIYSIVCHRITYQF